MRTIERISKRASSFISNIKGICFRSINVLSSFSLRKKKLKILARMENIEYAELYNNLSLAKIIVSHDNPTYSSIDGVLYSKDGTELIRFPPASKKSTFQVPDSVSSIENGAFWDCTSLTKLTIPNSVTSIGGFAFAYCEFLTEITISDSVTSIEDDAFDGCTSLKNINVSPNNLTYSSIDGVLYSKDGTELIRFPPGSEKNTFQVPDSVTTIGDKAFHGCSSLTEITIPNSVTTIGGEAFWGCTSLT